MLPASTEGQLVLFSNLDILPISSQHSYVDYWGTRVSSFEISDAPQGARPDSHESRRGAAARASRAPAGLGGAGGCRLRGYGIRRAACSDPPHRSARRGREARGGHPRESENPCDAALKSARDRREGRVHAGGHRRAHHSGRGMGRTPGRVPGHRAPRARRLRSVGIPARYVSGYLHPSPTRRLARLSRVSRTPGSSGSAVRGADSTRPTSSTSATATCSSATGATTTTSLPCAVSMRGLTARPSSSP